MKIGLRIPGHSRQLPFADFCKWCKDNGFDAIDIGETTPEIVQTARDAVSKSAPRISRVSAICLALKIYTESRASAAKAAIEAAADNDVHIMFCVFVPEDAVSAEQKL